jgi:hypothetical protein
VQFKRNERGECYDKAGGGGARHKGASYVAITASLIVEPHSTRVIPYIWHIYGVLVVSHCTMEERQEFPAENFCLISNPKSESRVTLLIDFPLTTLYNSKYGDMRRSD